MSNNWINWNTTPTGYQDHVTHIDIELLKREIGQRFPFYDMRYNANTAMFFCRVENETLEEKFDDLRVSLSKKGYIPMLRYEKGEYIMVAFISLRIEKARIRQIS